MLPGKILENLHIAIAILVFFEQFSSKLYLIFLLLILMCLTKHDAFCTHISIYVCSRRKVYCYRRGTKFWKSCIH